MINVIRIAIIASGFLLGLAMILAGFVIIFIPENPIYIKIIGPVCSFYSAYVVFKLALTPRNLYHQEKQFIQKHGETEFNELKKTLQYTHIKSL